MDVGHTWEPYASQAKALGYQTWFTSKDTPGLILDGLVVSATLIQQRPAQLQGLTRAWFRAVEWWKTHQQEGNTLIEKQLNLPRGSISLDGVHLYDQDENRRAFSGRDSSPSTLAASLLEHVDFFVSRGQLVHRLKPEELLDGRFAQ